MPKISEATDLLNRSQSTIRRMIKREIISAVKIGRDFEISISEIERIKNFGTADRLDVISALPKNSPRSASKKGRRPWEK